MILLSTSFGMLFIIAYMWDKNKNALISILPAIGMVGTFIGIVYSLQSIDFNDVQNATPQILNGMGVAFITSILGTGLSIIIRMHIVSDESNLPEETTLETIAKLLSEGNQKTVELKEIILNKNDELITEFKTFAEKQAENNTNALIDALKEVMRDFNAKINEQFGDNFKQLNEAVGRLLTWQENYYTQIEMMSSHIENSSKVLETNKDMLVEISEKYTNSMEVSSKLEQAIECLNLQRETLEEDMKKFSELTEKSKEVFPLLEENINGLTYKLSESVAQSAQNVEDIILNQKDQMDSNIDNLNKVYESSLNEINSLQSKIIDNLKNSVSETDKGLRDTLNKSLNSLGQQLTALSQKFVDDYKPLTERLTKIVQISEGVTDVHGQS